MKLRIPNIFCQSGFTLIELMVAMLIIGIMMGIGIPSFVNYSNAQALQSSTSDLLTLAQTAKSRAESRVVPNSCNLAGNSLNGWEIVIPAYNSITNPNTNIYYLKVSCGGTESIITTKYLPSNLIFTSTTDTTNPLSHNLTFFYHILQQGLTGDPGVVIKQTNTGSMKTLSVTSMGIMTAQ